MVRRRYGRFYPVFTRSSGRDRFSRRSEQVEAWHSEESDGYYEDGTAFYPCFHTCGNCGYLKRIFKNEHQKKGKGWDDMRNRERRQCRRCRYLEHNGDCKPVPTS